MDSVYGSIRRREIMIDGEPFWELCYEVDFGGRNGTVKVRVLDPCVTKETAERRQKVIADLCQKSM